eukprot:GHVQ01035442.1.p1 GENE.GHVQ01035442.1~~GHVQ01035442.1.p1  ORF type:complete len:119 (-),score=7.84 GHVQ01035442.1:4-360(-)
MFTYIYIHTFFRILAIVHAHPYTFIRIPKYLRTHTYTNTYTQSGAGYRRGCVGLRTAAFITFVWCRKVRPLIGSTHSTVFLDDMLAVVVEKAKTVCRIVKQDQEAGSGSRIRKQDQEL